MKLAVLLLLALFIFGCTTERDIAGEAIGGEGGGGGAGEGGPGGDGPGGGGPGGGGSVGENVNICTDSDGGFGGFSLAADFNPPARGDLRTLSGDLAHDFCIWRQSFTDGATSFDGYEDKTYPTEVSRSDGLREYVCGPTHEENSFIILDALCLQGAVVGPLDGSGAYCGNGVVDVREQCDDGGRCMNLVTGVLDASCPSNQCASGEFCIAQSADGCNAQCMSESCGDGVVANGEQCDDGGYCANSGNLFTKVVLNDGFESNALNVAPAGWTVSAAPSGTPRTDGFAFEPTKAVHLSTSSAVGTIERSFVPISGQAEVRTYLSNWDRTKLVTFEILDGTTVAVTILMTIEGVDPWFKWYDGATLVLGNSYNEVTYVEIIVRLDIPRGLYDIYID